MTAFERDGTEVDALLTDLYLESVLARVGTDRGPADVRLDPLVRDASDRLRRDLLRVHPSFRFEERLAARLAELAAAMRMPAAAGGGHQIVPLRADAFASEGFDPLADDVQADPEHRDLSRPLLIGGALTSAAISLAGAAFVAWRRGRTAGPMVRAARAVRAARLGPGSRLT